MILTNFKSDNDVLRGNKAVKCKHTCTTRGQTEDQVLLRAEGALFFEAGEEL